MLDALLNPFGTYMAMRELGGPVVHWIFIACVAMWAIVIERVWYFSAVLPRQVSILLKQWNGRPDRRSWTAHQVRRAMISTLNSGMSARLGLLRVLVPMCPLLGLLGTVWGMLNVFDSMAAHGSADARTMATGVSEAMICTLSGLAVSITGLYPVFYFRRKVRLETERLADKFVY